MKLKFDKICTCSQLQGYDGMMGWWKLRKEFERAMKSGFILNDPEKEFNYKQALEIVIQDGKTTMKDCERCSA